MLGEQSRGDPTSIERISSSGGESRLGRLEPWVMLRRRLSDWFLRCFQLRLWDFMGIFIGDEYIIGFDRV